MNLSVSLRSIENLIEDIDVLNTDDQAEPCITKSRQNPSWSENKNQPSLFKTTGLVLNASDIHRSSKWISIVIILGSVFFTVACLTPKKKYNNPVSFGFCSSYCRKN